MLRLNYRMILDELIKCAKVVLEFIINQLTFKHSAVD